MNNRTLRLQGNANRTYFAAEPFKSEEIGKKLITKVEEYESHILVRQVDERLALAYQHYFGVSPDSFHATSIVARAGDQGELAEIRINHARALVQSLLNLIIKDKFVWQPRAANYSYQAVRQTELASSVLEHYWHNHRVKQLTDRAVEEAIAFTEGFVMLEWDECAGLISHPDPSPDNPDGVLRTGDLRYRNISSWDVIRDPNAKSWDELRWIITRVMTNRYDAVARIYKRTDITQDEQDFLAEKLLSVNNLPYNSLKSSSKSKDWESDDIPVFRFYHKPDAILEYGRETHFLADGTVILDVPLDLDVIPVFRVAPAELIGTPFGYSQYLEILGIQEMSDSIQSSLASNISTFTAQSVIIEEGVNIQIEDLAGGMKVLYRPSGSDKDAVLPLQLTKSPPEAFTFVGSLKSQQELLMGLNETVRGQVQSDRMSGSAMALLDTQALRQASALASNYIRLVQDVGTYSVRKIRKHATIPLKIAMVGKSKMSLVRETEITGDDLSEVDQVFVDIGNPMTQTAAGRFDLATQMMQMKLLTDPAKVIEVLETGRLEAATQKDREELRNILRENEMITEGEKPVVMLHDNHLIHGKEHSNPVSSPEARLNEKVVTAYINHMHDHYQQFFGVPPGQYVPDMMSPPDPATGQPRIIFQQTDPIYRERMLILSGQPPPPPMAPMPPNLPPPGMGPSGMAPGGPGQGPEGAPVPNPGSNAAPAGPDAGAAPGGPPGAEPSNLPQQPQNPSTGERWNPQDGGAGPGTPA